MGAYSPEESEEQTFLAEKDDEAKAWPAASMTASASLSFWADFLGLRMGPNGDQLLDASARQRLLEICRAVSWVESRHGTGAGHHPQRDPMQCGNPADEWWKEITGQSGKGSRFVRGPGLPNLDAKELVSSSEKDPSFPAAAKTSLLSGIQDGHKNTQFTPAHSYVWGLPLLIHRANTKAGDDAFHCRDLSRKRLVDGAFHYNGGGDPNYRSKVERALAMFGGLQFMLEPAMPPAPEAPASTVEQLLMALRTASGPAQLRKAVIEMRPDGRLRRLEVEF